MSGKDRSDQAIQKSDFSICIGDSIKWAYCPFLLEILYCLPCPCTLTTSSTMAQRGCISSWSAVFSLCSLSPREDYAGLIKTNNSVSPPQAKQVSSIIQEHRMLCVIAPFPSFLSPLHNSHWTSIDDLNQNYSCWEDYKKKKKYQLTISHYCGMFILFFLRQMSDKF